MVELRRLGPLDVVVDGVADDVGGRQPRTLLAVLLAAGGRSVLVDALAEAIERVAAQGAHALAGRALRVAAEAEVAIGT